jgi:Bacterial Ig-like domain (group 2)
MSRIDRQGSASAGFCRWPRVLLSLALVLLGACGGGDNGAAAGSGGDSPPPVAEPPPPPSPPFAQGLALFPKRVALSIDDEGVLIAQAAAGALVWSSSDPGVATVDAAGRVKALAKGSTTISAASATSTATATLTVYRTTGAHPDPSSESLIAQALAANRISAEQALTFRVFALFGDSRLPPAFEGAPSEHPDHLLMRDVAGRLPTLSKATQDLLLPFLIPPIYAESWHSQPQQVRLSKAARLSAAREQPLADVTTNCFVPQFAGATRTTEHFKIWGYFGNGLLGGDDGQPTNESFVDFIASVVEAIYRSETALFKRLPLSDAGEPCNGGDGKIDIYLSPLDMAGRMPAQTVAYPNRCEKVPAYIVLNPIAMTLSMGRATVASPLARNKQKWKSVIAHEFLHVLQFGMDRQAACADYTWFDEATATWVIDHVDPQGNFEDGGGVPGGNGFARRQGQFVMNYLYNDHRVSIENASPESNPELNGYGDYLFFQYLARRYQPETIAQMFDATVGMASVEAVASVVDAKGGMTTVWPEFATTLWNDDAGQVLDYWRTEDSYDIGLAAIYSPTASATLASAKLKTRDIEQKGQPRASFKLFDNTLVNGTHEFQPRSIHYEHLKFSDASVHSVFVFNPIAVFPNNAFMRLQAKKKVGGQWQATEDWTAAPYQQFCLDKKSERVEELLLIVSNSEVHRGVEQPFRIPATVPLRVATSNVGCWKWQGSATTTITDTQFNLNSRAVGDVTLEVVSALPGRLIFEPGAGLIKAGATQTLGCTTSLVAADKTVAPGAGSNGRFDFNLDLDIGFSDAGGEPPDRKMITLMGSALMSTTTTMTCPQNTITNVSDQTWEWLRVNAPSLYSVSADGQAIEGQFTSVLGTTTTHSVWKFTAIKE